LKSNLFTSYSVPFFLLLSSIKNQKKSFNAFLISGIMPLIFKLNNDNI